MFFSRMSVKKRLFIGFGIMILLVMASGVLAGYLVYQTSQATGNLYQLSYAGSTAVMRIETNVLRIHRSMKDVALAIDQEGIDAAVVEVNASEEKVYGDLDRLKALFPGIDEQIESLKKLLADWKPIRDMVIALMSGGSRFEAANITKGREADQVTKINAALDELLTIAGQKAEGFMAASQKANESSLTIIAVLVGVTILVGILLALAVSSSIINPLRTIVGFTQKVADGDLNAEADRRLGGEFGQAQDAVARMVAVLKEGREEIERNVEGLNKILSDVSLISNHVAEGSGQVSESSQALSRGATQQAASLEQITSAMTELGSQTKVNAGHASDANRISDQARDMAESGNHRMKEMVTAMSGIADSSKEIARIIKTIDDIAFQTNLLALNAAVEAARAGVHGKGFAVVAQEVRNLAGRSAHAAHETAALIESAVNNVENGTKIVNSTAEALDEIVRNVNQVSDLVAAIAEASDEQADSIAQINQGLGLVEQVTHQNTASAEETASAAEELSGQAGRLKQVVSRFQSAKKIVKQKNETPDEPPRPPKRMTRDAESTKVLRDLVVEKVPQIPKQKRIALDDTEFEEF